MWISIQELRFFHRNKEIISYPMQKLPGCVLLHSFPFPLPIVFFSFSVCSFASAQNGESWMTSKMSSLFIFFDAPPVIYKQISMSNQDHSLSPTISKLLFVYWLWIFIALHTLINSPWVQTGNSVDCVKAFPGGKTALSLLSLADFQSGCP